jgi:hypothetical protein
LLKYFLRCVLCVLTFPPPYESLWTLRRGGVVGTGYACDDQAGIYFEGNEVKKVVSLKEESNAYYVYEENGEAKEKKLEKEVLK